MADATTVTDVTVTRPAGVTVSATVSDATDGETVTPVSVTRNAVTGTGTGDTVRKETTASDAHRHPVTVTHRPGHRHARRSSCAASGVADRPENRHPRGGAMTVTPIRATDTA